MNLDLDLDLPRFGDDQGALPEAEAFPPMTAQGPTQTVFFRSSSGHPQESSESAEAPIRRRTAAPKYLTMDQQTSLSNNDLASWNNNYALNMASAAQAKQQHKASRLAKKNAIFFIYGIGIGGVGRGLGGAKLPSPLNMFAGDQLMTALGIEPSTRRKRNHADDEEATSDSEGRRRVRAREDDDDEVGRGDNMALDEDDAMDLGMAMQGDDVIPLSPPISHFSSSPPLLFPSSPPPPSLLKQVLNFPTGHRSRPPRRPRTRRLLLPNALEHHRFSTGIPRWLRRPRSSSLPGRLSKQCRRLRLQRRWSWLSSRPGCSSTWLARPPQPSHICIPSYWSWPSAIQQHRSPHRRSRRRICSRWRRVLGWWRFIPDVRPCGGGGYAASG